jgi:hypothetical protein
MARALGAGHVRQTQRQRLELPQCPAAARELRDAVDREEVR